MSGETLAAPTQTERSLAMTETIPLAPALSPNAEGADAASPSPGAAVAEPAAAPPRRWLPLPYAISRRRGGVALAALLALGGAVTVWQSSLLDIGNFDLPGPGFFPLALGATLIVLATAIGVESWRMPEGEPIEVGHRDVLVVIAALLAVPIAFEPLGALPTLGLFGAGLLIVVARTRVPIAIFAAAIGMAACWYFFQVLLGLQLPAGPLM